ncbi:protein kinase family protein [Amycolatopsis orientalis]|uniref:protein kinase family protein n=1 Tax=Amycolatopsis orientalis TaxID=31958 RepID=UPI0003A31FD4|nr:protein kinase family protein [Amycolatopsis orientalis]
MRRPAVGDPLWIGQYRVLAELSRGETTRVLLGSGPGDRLVALTLPLSAENAGFRAETAALSAVLEADPDASTPWRASEFQPGPTLHEVSAPLPEPARLRLAAGISADLTQLHSAGVAHGNLDASHVRLTSSRARLVARATGTAPADDLLALGTLLAGETSLPEALRRCLAENPADRPTAAELVEALGPAAAPWPPSVDKLIAEHTAETAQFLDNQPVTPDQTDPVIYQVSDAPTASPRSPISRRRVLIGALALVIAGLAAWLAWPNSPAPDALPPAPQPPLVESGFLVAHGHPEGLQFSHDGRLLATLNADFTIDVLDVGTRKPAGPRLGPFPRARPAGLTFRPDGSALVVAWIDSKQFTAQTWDPRTGQEIGAPLVLDDIDFDSTWATLSPDGTIAVVPMASPRRLELWRVADRTRVGSIETPAAFRGSQFSPDGHTLAVYQWDGHSAHTSQVALWDAASLKPMGGPVVWGDDEQISSFSFTPDSRTLITTSGGDARKPVKVQQWDAATRKELRPRFFLPPAQFDAQPSDALYTMAIAGLDDQHLLALSAGRLAVVGLDGKQQGAGLPGIASLAVSPDRGTVATASASSAETTIHLWRKP